jgi:hypothetical protein
VSGPSRGERPPVRSNPYVGPRAFRQNEPFYGRELESVDLLNKLLPAGIVLLYSPSGAGKTSLIQASLVDALERQGFQICGATEPRFSALRVNLPPPKGIQIANRYVFSVVNGLVGHRLEPQQAAQITIEEALDLFAAPDRPADAADGATAQAEAAATQPQQFVVIDQLEEILTLSPDDLPGQTEFFRQLGAALRHGRRWAILAMREDYIGGIDKFRCYFQNELRATYRIDYLTEDSALRAVQRPAADHGVNFADDAARQLIADLRRVRAEIEADSLPTQDAKTSRGATRRMADQGPFDVRVVYPYVEPVLLQVVCDSLWRILTKRKTSHFTEITLSDLDYVKPYNRALSQYYRHVVREAAGKDREVERAIRDWTERHLMTKQGLRRPTRTPPPVPNPEPVMDTLRNRYLIRDDPRPGGTWWELAHDMIVQPIVEDNQTWRLSHLYAWQVVADQWYRSGRDPGLLLKESELRDAWSTIPRHTLTKVEREFLSESRRSADEEGHRTRMKSQLTVLRLSLAASALLNAALIVVLLLGA